MPLRELPLTPPPPARPPRRRAVEMRSPRGASFASAVPSGFDARFPVGHARADRRKRRAGGDALPRPERRPERAPTLRRGTFPAENK